MLKELALEKEHAVWNLLGIKGPYAGQRVMVPHFPPLCLGPDSFVALMPKKGTDRKSSLPEFAQIQVLTVWHSTFPFL